MTKRTINPINNNNISKRAKPTLSPDEIKQHIKTAQQHAAYSDFSSALPFLDDALTANPNTIPALRLRGHIYQHQKKFNQALTDFNQVIERNPNDAVILRRRGDIYLELNQLDFALLNLNKALSIEPNDPIALERRAMVYYKQKNTGAAIDDFTTILLSHPTHLCTLCNRSRIYLEQGNFFLAKKDIERILEIDPNNQFAIDAQKTIPIQHDRQNLLAAYPERLFNKPSSSTSSEDEPKQHILMNVS